MPEFVLEVAEGTTASETAPDELLPSSMAALGTAPAELPPSTIAARGVGCSSGLILIVGAAAV